MASKNLMFSVLPGASFSLHMHIFFYLSEKYLYLYPAKTASPPTASASIEDTQSTSNQKPDHEIDVVPPNTESEPKDVDPIAIVASIGAPDDGVIVEATSHVDLVKQAVDEASTTSNKLDIPVDEHSMNNVNDPDANPNFNMDFHEDESLTSSKDVTKVMDDLPTLTDMMPNVDFKQVVDAVSDIAAVLLPASVQQALEACFVAPTGTDLVSSNTLQSKEHSVEDYDIEMLDPSADPDDAEKERQTSMEAEGQLLHDFMDADEDSTSDLLNIPADEIGLKETDDVNNPKSHAASQDDIIITEADKKEEDIETFMNQDIVDDQVPFLPYEVLPDGGIYDLDGYHIGTKSKRGHLIDHNHVDRGFMDEDGSFFVYDEANKSADELQKQSDEVTVVQTTTVETVETVEMLTITHEQTSNNQEAQEEQTVRPEASLEATSETERHSHYKSEDQNALDTFDDTQDMKSDSMSSASEAYAQDNFASNLEVDVNDNEQGIEGIMASEDNFLSKDESEITTVLQVEKIVVSNEIRPISESKMQELADTVIGEHKTIPGVEVEMEPLDYKEDNLDQVAVSDVDSNEDSQNKKDQMDDTTSLNDNVPVDPSLQPQTDDDLVGENASQADDDEDDSVQDHTKQLLSASQSPVIDTTNLSSEVAQMTEEEIDGQSPSDPVIEATISTPDEDYAAKSLLEEHNSISETDVEESSMETQDEQAFTQEGDEPAKQGGTITKRGTRPKKGKKTAKQEDVTIEPDARAPTPPSLVRKSLRNRVVVAPYDVRTNKSHSQSG